MSSSSRTGGAPAPKPLSCSSCRQRKIKCDRNNPCLPCLTAGIECVTPNRVRAPRAGKQARLEARDAELLRRIARLESLMTSTDGINAFKESDEGNHVAVSESAPISTPSTISQNGSRAEAQPVRLDNQFADFIKRQNMECRNRTGDFWSSLGDEVGGLRQLIENPMNDDEFQEEPDYSNWSSAETKNSSPDFVFGDSYSHSRSPDITYPSDSHRDLLFQLYFNRVNNFCKILHKPFYTIHLQKAKELIDNEGRIKFSSIEAVTFAMYFAAVMSITSEDCWKYFSQDRDILLAQYQQGTEAALIKANFMDSSELITLQALFLYIMTLRTLNRTRSSWTLISLAIRIAHHLRIHRDGDGLHMSVFEAEMRRRLWWQIMVLDIRATEDRGSDPMILEDSFNTRMPCNINDEDFAFPTQQSPLKPCMDSGNGHDFSNGIRLLDRPGITEMTFCLMCMDMSVTSRKINFIPPTKEHALTLQEKETLVKECANKFESKYLANFDNKCPFTWVIYMFGRLATLKLWLAVQYPLQTRNEPSPVHVRAQSLRTSVSLLTVSDMLEENSVAAGLRWYFESHVPWHAVAVALVALCKETQGPLADQAWLIIDKNFDKWNRRMSGTQEGMAWIPMKILRKKARAARQQALAQAVARAATQQSSISTGSQDFNIIPELPRLSLEANITAVHNYPTFINFDTMEPVPYQPLGFDVFHSADMTLPSTDLGVDTINWDDWNEFVFDASAAGADMNDSMWGISTQM